MRYSEIPETRDFRIAHATPPSVAQPLQRQDGEGERAMLHYALMFLIVGLIAGALGLGGVAAIAGQIAWVLFLVGVILLVVHIARGHRVAP